MTQRNNKMSIIVANGVNLDLLGRREPEIYGTFTLDNLEDYLRCRQTELKLMFPDGDWQLCFFQSNSENEFFDQLDKDWQGAIINAGAWTHTSLALADRLSALTLPFVEVHISQPSNRQRYRQRSYLAQHALGVVSGFGIDSYLAALVALLAYLQKDKGGG